MQFTCVSKTDALSYQLKILWGLKDTLGFLKLRIKKKNLGMQMLKNRCRIVLNFLHIRQERKANNEHNHSYLKMDFFLTALVIQNI